MHELESHHRREWVIEAKRVRSSNDQASVLSEEGCCGIQEEANVSHVLDDLPSDDDVEIASRDGSGRLLGRSAVEALETAFLEHMKAFLVDVEPPELSR